MVVLGGMGTLFGPVLGAIAYVGVEELFKDSGVVGPLAEHWQIPMGVFVIAVVLLLRRGLAGLLLAPPLSLRLPRADRARDGKEPAGDA